MVKHVRGRFALFLNRVSTGITASDEGRALNADVADDQFHDGANPRSRKLEPDS